MWGGLSDAGIVTVTRMRTPATADVSTTAEALSHHADASVWKLKLHSIKREQGGRFPAHSL